MGQAETLLTQAVKKELENWNLVDKVEKIHQSGFSAELGTPDIRGKFKDGTEFFLELKVRGKEFSGLTFNQAFQLWREAKKGSCVAVIASKEDLREFRRSFQANHEAIEKYLNRLRKQKKKQERELKQLELYWALEKAKDYTQINSCPF